MGEHHLHLRHPDYQYVCCGRAEIVLNKQGAARACRYCRQTGMVELKRSGFFDASHKRGDQRPIRFRDAISPGAVDLFGRYVRLQPVQFLVQIHDQQVKAVTRSRPAGRHRRNGFSAHHVIGDRRPRANKLLETLVIALVYRCRGLRTARDQSQRRKHRRHRIIENGNQALGAGNMVIAAPVADIFRHTAVEVGIGKPARPHALLSMSARVSLADYRHCWWPTAARSAHTWRARCRQSHRPTKRAGRVLYPPRNRRFPSWPP